MNFEDYLDNIGTKHIEDSDDMMYIAEYCGMDVVRKLVQHCSGLDIYISQKIVDRIKKNYICEYCKTNDSKTIRRFAIECGFTEKYVRLILEKERGMAEGQLPLPFPKEEN